MSRFCELALAAGMTFFDLCAPVEAPPLELPPQDASIFTFKKEPAPPPPPPPVEPAPVFPPVIVEKEVVRYVEKEAPPVKTPPPAKAPPPKAEPPKPDPVRLWLEGGGARRTMASYDPDKSILTASAPDKPGDQGFDLPAEESISVASKPPSQKEPLPDFDIYGFPKETSTGPVDNTRILAADRYITGILETGINSQIDSVAGGSVIIQTSRDVFGYHADKEGNRKILIPKGSRLICDYDSPTEAGVSRIAVQCKRILTAEVRAEIRQLSAPVGNVQGHAGVTGEVDNRFFEKYGTAILLATTSGAIQAATAYAATRNNKNVNTVTNIIGNGTSQVTDQFGQITTSVLEENLDLGPIITIPQGSRVQIRAQKDWYMAEWETL